MNQSPDQPRIVFLDRATLAPSVTLREPGFAHDMISYDRSAAGDVAGRIEHADIVITNKVKLTESAIAQAPRLRFVAVAATGTDNVDLAACRARGIIVSNIRDYAVNTVPEHTFALILALRRSLLAYRDSVRAGRWQESGQFCYFDYPIEDLAGSVLGIIGSGALGSKVAALGQAFGMKVIFAGRKDAPATAGHVEFGEFLARADIITLHCPLTPGTRHMIDAASFAAMRRHPLLINTARGGLVDEMALGDALRSGQIAGAGFDVATAEPLPADHPLMALCDMPNFILTPHVAWASHSAMQALADQLIGNIEAFMAGTPRHIV